MKFAELLLRYLRSAGIRHIFGIAGREASAIMFDEYPDKIKFILTRHELTAGVAAASMSRFTNSPQVCFGTLGPGATNYMTAIGTATIDRNPLIVIAAQIETDSISYNDAHQCIDAVSIAKPLCKYSYELKNSNELKGVLEQAIAASMTFPFGPSFISIPIDILGSEVNTNELRLRPFTYTESTANLDGVLLNKVCKMIDKSSHPMIVVGDTITKINQAPQLIRKFAELKNIPIITTYSAKGILPPKHKLNHGVINAYGNVLLEENVKQTQFDEVDLLILIGYDLIEHYPNAWKGGIPKKIININPYHNNAPSIINPEISVIGNLDKTISYLGKKCTKHEIKQNALSKVNKKFDLMISDTIEYDEGIMVNQVIGALDRHFGDYILANDIGTHRHVTALYYQPKRIGDYVTSAGFSSFGTGLPMGLGAKLANPTRNVVVIAGDGGFHSNSGDLETIARLGLKMTIIILNNDTNGLIKRYQLVGKEKRSFDGVVKFTHVDFAKLADANNCQGILTKTLSEFIRALKKADTYQGPTVIEVAVNYPDMYINSHSVTFTRDK